MYLRLDRFERLAERNGYRSGEDLLCALGCNRGTYYALKKGGSLDPDLAAEIYNRFGEEAMFEIISFGDEKWERKNRRKKAKRR